MTKTQGLVIVNTGDGKGKTTAALGVAFRSAGNGMKVMIRQFIKGSWTPGEYRAVKAFPETIDLKPLGKGFIREKDEAAMAEAMKESRVEAQLEGKDIKKIIFVPGRILNIIAK